MIHTQNKDTKTSAPATPAGAETPAATSSKASLLAMQSKSIVDAVEARISEFIKTGQLQLPKDYSVSNALKSAWLVLQGVEDKNHNKALTVCTRDSIANSLLDMIVQGLNPGKKQCYFIVYGETLTCSRSYFGSMAVAQMVKLTIMDWGFAVVYEGDTFEYGIQNGKKSVITHKQDLKNVDKKKIIAAYCMALDKDGNPLKTDIMTIDEIHQAWKMSKTMPFTDKGELKAGSTHGQFAADMSLRTVINKTCKTIINASSDNALLLERINRNEDLADAAAIGADIKDQANTGTIIQIPEKTTGQEGTANEEKPQEDPICVCEQFKQDKATEWDCPKCGRYQKGVYIQAPSSPPRKPGF